MQQFVVQENEAGQRLDRFLSKYLKEASTGFLHKMLRKKNITLNGKKADGRERLSQGDCIRFFFSEETFQQFRGVTGEQSPDDFARVCRKAYEKLSGIRVIYENEYVLLADKPAGILTQKAHPSDISVNEWLIGYLLQSRQLDSVQLETFRPSVCNRLDRNTSGLVICGKSLTGSRTMSELIRNRQVRKFYRTLAKGRIQEGAYVKGYLKKDSASNKVEFREKLPDHTEEYEAVETRYEPLFYFEEYTCLEVELITGKPHQIRAHLASLGHPLMGDSKYGDPGFNRRYKAKLPHSGQLLHACRLEFPAMMAPFEDLSEKSFHAPLPFILMTNQEKKRLCPPGNPEV